MDWSDLGESIADFAPMLGALLPIPGGTAIGKMISSAFGSDSDDPEELAKIIKADPQAAIKLREIELNNKVDLEKLVIKAESNRLASDTARIESVNATMRAESISGDAWQRRWRPFWGYISGFVFFLQMLVIFWAVIFKTASAVAIITAMSSLAVFWSVPLAVLGISSYQRGKEKRAALGENVKPLLSMFNKK
jgi:hypothetical protein